MNTSRLNLLLIVVFLFLANVKTSASHLMGGELSYFWISGNDYLVKLTLYRDCAGAPITNSEDIGVYSTSCQDSFLVTLPKISFEKLTPACDSNISSCNGGSAFGYERHVFMDTVTLPLACSDWHFVYTVCCRNGMITNLVSPNGQEVYFYASLDNLNVPYNNSPVFSADPISFLNTGQSYLLNNGAYDVDGDSLVISLSNALGSGPDGINSPSTFTSLVYNAPFSFNNPVTSSPPLSLDPVTGNISVNPQISEVDIVVYKIEEYRNGNLIGTITRDVQLIIQNGTNQIPVLSGINGTSDFTVNMCYTDTLQFNINSSDLDPADSSQISWHSFTGTNATATNYSFITSGGLNDSAMFTFTPDSSDISSLPYFLYVKVKDNACPYNGYQTYCYVIYVNSCSQEVWPGDANSDLTVNLYDLLPIGLAYNNTGPVRGGASLLWVAQPSANWAGSFISGVNHKHADCNGDGIVNIADTAGISANFGLSHPAKLKPVMPGTATIADMYMISSPDTVSASQVVNINIYLGTSLIPVDSIYGIAFRINFNPAFIDPVSGTISYAGSWMGTQGSDMITFDRSFTSLGYADIAMVRNTHTNISGDSLLCVYSIVIVDNIAGKSNLSFEITDVYAITYSESQLNFNLIGDSIVVSTSTGINDQQALEERIKLYPIPSQHQLNIDAGSLQVDQIEITDLTGRTILVLNNRQNKNISVDLTGISNGSYLVSVKTAQGIVNRRIHISRE